MPRIQDRETCAGRPRHCTMALGAHMSDLERYRQGARRPNGMVSSEGAAVPSPHGEFRRTGPVQTAHEGPVEPSRRQHGDSMAASYVPRAQLSNELLHPRRTSRHRGVQSHPTTTRVRQMERGRALRRSGHAVVPARPPRSACAIPRPRRDDHTKRQHSRSGWCQTIAHQQIRPDLAWVYRRMSPVRPHREIRQATPWGPTQRTLSREDPRRHTRHRPWPREAGRTRAPHCQRRSNQGGVRRCSTSTHDTGRCSTNSTQCSCVLQ